MDQTVEMALARRFMALPSEKAARFLEGMRTAGIDPMLLPIPAAEPGTRTQCHASAAQQRLWFLWRMHPESPAYTLVRAVRLQGLLARSALEQTFNALVARHEALRTTFFLQDGRVVQRINPATPIEIPLLDLSGSTESAGAREERAREIASSEEQRAFNLESGPLLRVSLVRLDERDHVLVVAIHHIASDGWSMGVLFDEITTFYEAFAAGRAPALRPLRIQYADFAEWQRKWLDAGELSRQVGYWKSRLGTDHPLLDLPAQRARPAQSSLRGETFSFSLDAPLTSALHAVAQRFDVTLFVLLLAAFKALLHRYTGAQDLRVGMPVANRNRVETEQLIGFFVNMQVIRSEPRGDMRFDQLLDAVRIAALEAQSCQDLPFDELVDALNPPRSLSHHPLFQVAHNHQWRRREKRLPSHGLSVSGFSYESRSTQFDLTLSTEASAESIEGDEVPASFIYSTDLFDRPTIECLARHWTCILRFIAGQPETPLRLLPLLDAEEQERALARGRPRSEFPGSTCLHTRFESHAATTPNAIAVTHDGRHVTYADLNARANKLAHHLLGRGLAPETLVGICIERSAEMIVAILAVLKAGGAYVPLDPSYPAQRLQDTLRDGDIEWLLTTSSALERLSPESGMMTLLLDELDLSAGSTSDPDVPVHPQFLAYVIYTSGSTGRPKGAMLCHRNVSRLLDATHAWFEFGPADAWTLFHSYAFDFSVWELFGALCTGGRLVIVPHEISRSAGEFFALLRDQKVTVLNQTPSAFKQLMQAAISAAPQDVALRVVIFGGEALDPCSLRPWIEQFGDARPRLINMYGITETTVHVTYRPITAADMEGLRSPIGACIADLGMQVLGCDLNLLPSGAAGELYVAGAGLARGYLSCPALTCERFVADPFSACGARVYRTGDLGRSRDDGDLEYLGRVDQQVKLRGYRIELGEIEDCLIRSGQVREVVVVVDASGGEQDKRLIAYVVAHPGEEAESPQWQERLRTFLQRNLPEYMVPAHYVPLDRLPLNVSGKIDRKALPTPDRPWSAARYEPPRDAIEARLAQIWGEILKVERVGRRDDFFVLGGHSLTATQAVVQISAALRIDLPVRTLFEASELQRFAEHVRAHILTAREARHPLVRQTRDRPLPLSHAQQRLWFLWKLEPDTGAFNIPVAVHLTGLLDVHALERSFNALVRRHDVLRTRFAEGAGSDVHQEVRELHEIAIEHLDLRVEPADRRLAAAKARAEAMLLLPFDLEKGPLLRVTLMRLDEQEHVLLVTMHHIVADGSSMSIVVQEFTEFYRAFAENRKPKLPALPIQYSDYAIWHRQWVEEAELDRQLAYWKQELQENIEPLQLPASRPRPSVAEGRGACHPVTLGWRIAQRLRAVATRHRVTLFSLLLLALAVVLRHRSGRQRFLLGTNVENRPRAELASLVGFFVNQLVLKVDLAGACHVAEALRSLHATVLGALDNQDLPFDRLVDALRPRRRHGHAPFFNIKLIYQQGAAALPTLPGLRMREMPIDRNAVELDLIVEFLESADTLHLNLAYRVELFDQADMTCLGKQLAAALDCLAENDNVSLDRLEETVAELQRQRFVALQAERSARMHNVKLVSRRPAPAVRSLATIRPYREDNSLIALCTPAAANVSLSVWATHERRVIDQTLARHGAILFRGFPVASPREFSECIDALGGAALEYRFRSSPRTQVDPALRVYTSTEYPASERIFPHNENSYAAEFPLRLFFYCETPAAQGGATPIGDARAVLREIHPEVRERFTRKQVLYVRNFGDGLGLPWQDVFQTDKREEVEQYCARGGIEVQWRSGGRLLHTRRKGPAIVRHPLTGELSWFNHATFFNALTLPERARADLLREFGPDELPQNTFYGEGSPIEPDVIAHLQEVYGKAMVEFTWQQGDLLMIDNLSTAHARNAFSGTRRILVGMTGTGKSEELELRPEDSACR